MFDSVGGMLALFCHVFVRVDFAMNRLGQFAYECMAAMRQEHLVGFVEGTAGRAEFIIITWESLIWCNKDRASDVCNKSRISAAVCRFLGIF